MNKRLFEMQIKRAGQWESCGGFSVEELDANEAREALAEQQKAFEDLNDSTRSKGPSREPTEFRTREIGAVVWFYFTL